MIHPTIHKRRTLTGSVVVAALAVGLSVAGTALRADALPWDGTRLVFGAE